MKIKKEIVGYYLIIILLIAMFFFIWCEMVKINREPVIIQDTNYAVSTNEKLLIELRKTNQIMYNDIRERFEWIR